MPTERAHDSCDDELERETLRLYRRYVSEVVERFALCPWAERARQEGHVTERVFDQTSPDLFEPSLGVMDALSPHAELDVVLFIYPRLSLGRLDFEHFARRLRTLDAERHEPGSIPFAIAAFHPDASPVLHDPERLIPFLRRTPDPTLQLVREASLRRVRGADHGTSFFGPHLFGAGGRTEQARVDVRERIALQNLATVREHGVDRLEATFLDIRRDREQVHARLAGQKPPEPSNR